MLQVVEWRLLWVEGVWWVAADVLVVELGVELHVARLRVVVGVLMLLYKLLLLHHLHVVCCRLLTSGGRSLRHLQVQLLRRPSLI